MKKPTRPLLLSICSLIMLSLACIFSTYGEGLHDNAVALRIDNISIIPENGPGPYSAGVKGPNHTQGDTLRCYISADTGNVEVFNRPIGPQSTDIGDLVIASFEFTYTVPGTHSLVCAAQTSKSSWSADFSVPLPPDTLPQTPSGDQPSNDQPLKINGSGTVSGTNSWGNPYSVRVTSALLTIKPDNSAELYVVYTINVDYTREEYMYFDGTANPADGTVTFTDCNLGGSPSGGTLAYTQQPLSGEYTCILTPKGGVQQEWKLKMP